LKSSIPSNTTAKAFFGITKPFLVVLRMCSGVRVPQPRTTKSCGLRLSVSNLRFRRASWPTLHAL
jgi:hypothetical protein